MSPSSLSSYDFLIKFKDAVDKFDQYMKFEPKYKFKNLFTDFNTGFLKEHCYGQGMYCATSEMILDSKSVLDEAIRQKCIWKLSQDDQTKKHLWWNYIGNYRNCLKDRLKNSTPKQLDCFEELMTKHNYSTKTKEAIDNCYNNSFENLVDRFNSQNKILKEDENAYEYSGVYLVPAFFVNKNLVKEDLKPAIVISAMCDKLIRKPEICQEFLFSNINWNYSHEVNKSHGFITILSLLSVGVIIILLMVFYVKRRMHSSINEEVSVEIRNHISEYMKLKDATS